MSIISDKHSQFLSIFHIACRAVWPVKISLGNYQWNDDLKSIIIKKITLKGEEVLNWVYRHKTRDITKNISISQSFRLFDTLVPTSFWSAHLTTLSGEYHWERFAHGKEIFKVLASESQNADNSPVSSAHDHQKKRYVDSTRPYLHALELTDAQGNVIASRQDKYRQINRYIELLEPLITSLDANSLKKIVDMGSGKGYLTFALADYLSQTLQISSQVIGVEYRADMVALCNTIAQKTAISQLSFVEGSIAWFDATDVNMLIALHACDTATDDAIASGILCGAELIVVAPCCHKQIRREMEKNVASSTLSFMTQYGVFLERQSEMVTDSIRAMILQYSGYRVKVFEFIESAHTPKNVMITALRDPKLPLYPREILEKIQTAKALVWVNKHYLEQKLGITA